MNGKTKNKGTKVMNVTVFRRKRLNTERSTSIKTDIKLIVEIRYKLYSTKRNSMLPLSGPCTNGNQKIKIKNYDDSQTRKRLSL